MLSCLVGGRRKVQVMKFAFEAIFVFFMTRACPVLKHNRVSEVFKRFKARDLEYYGQRNYVLKWEFNLRH